jgi:hypothetical protein
MKWAGKSVSAICILGELLTDAHENKLLFYPTCIALMTKATSFLTPSVKKIQRLAC